MASNCHDALQECDHLQQETAKSVDCPPLSHHSPERDGRFPHRYSRSHASHGGDHEQSSPDASNIRASPPSLGSSAKHRSLPASGTTSPKLLESSANAAPNAFDQEVHQTNAGLPGKHGYATLTGSRKLSPQQMSRSSSKPKASQSSHGAPGSPASPKFSRSQRSKRPPRSGARSPLSLSSTVGHDQLSHPSSIRSPERSSRLQEERSRRPSRSQSQEVTVLLTQSKIRLASILLGLGASIIICVLVVLVWRMVYKNWSTSYRGTTVPIGNGTVDRRPKAGVRTYCSNTGACADAYASLLRESIDSEANPCRNFYNYACGGWLRNYNTSTMAAEWRQYTMDAIERFRIDKVSTGMQNEPVGQAVHFLETCLNAGRTNDETDLKAVLAEARLTWPDRSEGSDFVNSLFFMARRVALPVFFGVNVGYTNAKLRAIFFPLERAFHKTAEILREHLRGGNAREYIRVLYEAFASGVVNETRLDEVIRNLDSLEDALDLYLQASHSQESIHDVTSLGVYAPSLPREKWAAAFQGYFNFPFSDISAVGIYDVRSFAAIFRYAQDNGEAQMNDVLGFLGVLSGIFYTRSKMKDAFFGSGSMAYNHQVQYCWRRTCMFYGHAINHYLFAKAPDALKIFGELHALIRKEFYRTFGLNITTSLVQSQPVPHDGQQEIILQFLRKSEPQAFLPRYKPYPAITKSALRNWMTLMDYKRKVWLAEKDNDEDDCARQSDTTLYPWRLTPYHLSFPWYVPGIQRAFLLAGQGTRIAAALFLEYVDRSRQQRKPMYEQHQQCLRSANPEHGKTADVELQASVAALHLALSSLEKDANGLAPVESIPYVGHLKEAQAFFAFYCHLFCGHSDGEPMCNLPLKHSAEFARAFTCETGTDMSPSKKCQLLPLAL
ncbi:hypothetical protein HPB49_024891 [Dermacentor silvarum]|uniref:Uncharacterized protein n=1 Tax=Dermacentor silvarum TaxID=543639 RepID=A0ACB8DSP2_DERSI|nr:hypothetical protein HPB49_024891 [Dermacentor silvarum]